MFAGYSGVTPSLWALMGFDAMYMRWAGTEEMFKQWTDVKGFEFIWEGSSKKISLQTLQEVRRIVYLPVMKHNYGDMSGYVDEKLDSGWTEMIQTSRKYLLMGAMSKRVLG